MQPSALTGHPERAVHTGSAPGSFVLVATRTGGAAGRSPRPAPRGGLRALLGGLRLARLAPHPAPRSEVLSGLHVSSLPPLGLGVPVCGGEGQKEPEEEPEAQSAGRGEAVRGRVLPLWGRRPAGAVRPQVLHQGLPPGLPGPGQAALRWVPAPSPACRSPWGPGWSAPCRARHVRLAVRVRVRVWREAGPEAARARV